MEAAAFSKYVYDYLSEEEFGKASFSNIQRREMLSEEQAVSERFVGRFRAKVKVVVFG